APGVGERDDSLGDAFGVREFDLEFEEGVLAAAHERHQLRARGLRRGRGQVLLKRAFREGFVTLVSEFSASHFCRGGALYQPPGCAAREARRIAGIKTGEKKEGRRHKAEGSQLS